MFSPGIDLTTALRPSLLPEESLLFVQAAVGLYEGKYKVPNYQTCQAYLTSHRVCLVDLEHPREYSASISLKEVDRHEIYSGFLKSSPKIILYPKISLRPGAQSRPLSNLGSVSRSGTSSPLSRHGTPSAVSSRPLPVPATNATWICPICSFSNPVPSNFDPGIVNSNTPLPPCLACGIKPPLAHVLKAVISNSSNRPYPSGSIETLAKVNNEDNRPPANIASQNASQSATLSGIPCPRCTFLNHKSLASCEICGASLTVGGIHGDRLAIAEEVRAESPGPARQSADLGEVDVSEGLKLSFRAGGEKLFYERLQEALVQRKWLLQGAPPVPKPQQSYGETNHFSNAGDRDAVPSRPRTVGIAGLEQRGFDVRKNNEIIIGNAFEDLETLMASAKEIVALAETFSSKVNGPNVDPTSEASAVLSQSAAAIGLVTTKDMLGGGSKSETLYLSELARNLAEYLTDDATGVLRKEGGIMSLVDLWAVFNRARGGVELVSPTDFEKAASLWEKLKLPLRLRRFKSGLLVVQSREWNDDKTIASLLSWLQDLRWSAPNGDAKWDWRLFGRGITAQEAAERFGWSVGVANEELEMAEERGVLCREESIAGVYFWENWFTDRDTLRGFDRWFEEMLPWRASQEQVV